MKFKINNRTWKIKEISQDKMCEIKKDKEPKGDYFGLTCYNEQTIYLWNELNKEQKAQSLLHELMHCYIGVFIDFQNDDKFTEEAMCNISANSHDIINKIVNDYFK